MMGSLSLWVCVGLSLPTGTGSWQDLRVLRVSHDSRMGCSEKASVTLTQPLGPRPSGFSSFPGQPHPAIPSPSLSAPVGPPPSHCTLPGLGWPLCCDSQWGMGAGVPQVFLGPSPPQHPTLPSAHPWAAWPSPSLTPSFRAGHLGVALIPFSSLSMQVPWSCHSLLCPKTSLPSSKHIAKCPGPLGLLGPTSPHGQGPPPLSASQSGLLQPSVTDGGGA